MSDVPAASSAAPTPAASSPASTPAPAPSSAPSTPASASATPSAPESPSAAPAPDQSVPYTRFKEVNDQLRAAREFQSKYERLQWAEQFHSDPYAFVDSWIDQLANHQQYGPQILAKAARMLQSRRSSQPQTVEEPTPDVPIVDGNGNVTGQTYSAAQLKKWREWDWQQKQSAFDQRLQPLEQMKQSLEQREAMAAIQQQSDQHATVTLTKMRQQSWFKDHEAAIKQHFAANESYGDNLAAAALDYFNEHVLPTYGQQAESKVLADLKTQANGGSVRPDGANASLPDFKKMKPAEVMKFMEDHPDVAERFAHR